MIKKICLFIKIILALGFFNNLNSQVQNNDTILHIKTYKDIKKLGLENKMIVINDSLTPKNSKVHCLFEYYETYKLAYEALFQKQMGHLLTFCPFGYNLKMKYLKVQLPYPMKKGNYEVKLVLGQTDGLSIYGIKQLEAFFSEKPVGILEKNNCSFQEIINRNIESNAYTMIDWHFKHELSIYTINYTAKGNESYIYFGVFKQDKRFNKTVLNELNSFGFYNPDFKLHEVKNSIFYANSFADDKISAMLIMPYIYIKEIIIIKTK